MRTAIRSALVLLALGVGTARAERLPATPAGLASWRRTAPRDNPVTWPRWALGRRLFWERRLSPKGDLACAGCHDPARGFSDGLPRARRPDGTTERTHTPSLYNVAFGPSYGWRGTTSTLRRQLALEWAERLGARGSEAPLVAALGDDPRYRRAFAEAFPREEVGPELVRRALECFVRSILSGGSAFDRFDAGDETALGPEARRGWELFRGKARCGNCHAGFALTDWRMHEVGGADEGGPRRIRTPGLRGVARHPPYGHDGALASLEEIVAQPAHPRRQGAGAGPPLAAEERRALVIFLRTLDGIDDPLVTTPPGPAGRW